MLLFHLLSQAANQLLHQKKYTSRHRTREKHKDNGVNGSKVIAFPLARCPNDNPDCENCEDHPLPIFYQRPKFSHLRTEFTYDLD
jgi:hypothetical protein